MMTLKLQDFHILQPRLSTIHGKKVYNAYLVNDFFTPSSDQLWNLFSFIKKKTNYLDKGKDCGNEKDLVR